MWRILIINSLVFSAHRGSKVAVALLAVSLETAAWLMGVLAALYAVAPMLLAVVSGRWSDRIGVYPPLLTGSGVLVIALALPGMWMSPAALCAAAILIGTGHILYQVSIQNAVGHLSDEHTRVGNYAAYSLTVSLSAVIGPFVAAVAIDHADHRTAFVVLSASALIAALLIVCSRRRFHLRPCTVGARKKDGASAGLRLLRIGPLRKVVVTSAVVMAAYDLFAFYLPLYAISIGHSASTVGIVLGCFGAAGVVVRIALPALVRRCGDARLLSICLWIAAIAYGVLPLCSGVAALCLLATLLGLALGCGPALLVPMTYARAPEGCSGEALGLRLTVSYAAHASVPLVLSGAGALLGFGAIFLVNGAMLVFGALYLGRSTEQSAPDELPMRARQITEAR